MATSAIYLHHERSTQAAAEADAQNREIVLDRTNLAPLGRFNDGTLWHGVTQEKPSVTLVALGVTGAITGGTTLAVTGLSTLAGGGVIAAATDSASKLQIGGSVSGKVTALTGNTTLDNTYHTLECDATAGSFVVTLPAAAGCVGRRYAFHKNDTSANTVTIDGNASETIDEALIIVLGGNVGNSHLVIVSNGTNWRIEWLYEEGTYTASMLGCTTVPTGTACFVRVGKNVTLFIPAFGLATSNTIDLNVDGIPSVIVPTRAMIFAVIFGITDNGTAYEGSVLTIASSSLLSISRKTAIGSLTSAFTGSGSKGLNGPTTITYTLQ